VLLARRFSRQVLQEWDVEEETAESVELVLSELMTNAVRHSDGPIAVRLRLQERTVRLEVADDDHRVPPSVIEPATDDDATSGRGLWIVQSLASRWGVESEGLSKYVWAELDQPASS
jgi:anti-sigma regulatory factor (Ser/Thr protein kinase)